MKDDTEHRVKFEITDLDFTVFLDYDPDNEFTEQCVIPIQYDGLMDCICIPDNLYRKIFNPNDCGIESNEIKLIDKIMECLSKNKEEIKEVLRLCSFENRKDMYDVY